LSVRVGKLGQLYVVEYHRDVWLTKVLRLPV
jgi:hypothetical protein